MAPSRLGVVLVAVLAASAGCVGLFGGGTSGETPTVTPVAVPEVSPSPAPGVPGGAASDRTAGDVDVGTILAADRRVRSNSSYRFERTATIDGPNGSIQFDRVRRVGVDGRVSETIRTAASGGMDPVFDSAQLWSNGTVVWSRTRFADGRVFLTRSVGSTDDPFGLGLDLPATVLGVTEVTVRPRASGGTVLVSETPFALRESLVPVATRGPRNATARLVVSERGLVRSVRLDYRTHTSGGPVTVSIRQRVTAVNETTVSRPGWVDRVRANDPRAG